MKTVLFMLLLSLALAGLLRQSNVAYSRPNNDASGELRSYGMAWYVGDSQIVSACCYRGFRGGAHVIPATSRDWLVYHAFLLPLLGVLGTLRIPVG